MREHIMEDGQQLPIDGIDRGQMIAYGFEYWLDTYERYIRARFIFDMTVLLALVALFAFGAVIMPVIGFVLLLCIGVVILTEVITFRATRRNIGRGGAIPGVYENGVELPMYPLYATRLFIPWTMMDDAWVKRSRISDDVLYIAVKGSRWRWRVPGRLFGVEGTRAVIERARTPVPIELPERERPAPRLVIYSAEGAKTESVPEDI